MNIHLRMHHFVCILCFDGKGYSPDFINNFANIVEQTKQKDCLVAIVSGADNICRTCPKLTTKYCINEPKVKNLDKEYMKLFGYKEGERVLWKNATKHILKKLSKEKFKTICSACSWYPLGICEKKISQFLKKQI